MQTSAKHERFKEDLETVMSQIKALLIEKNKNYGDSALTPVRVFFKGTVREGIACRIDDKLSRWQQGFEAGEDTLIDLIGYLLIDQIAILREERDGN